MKQLLDYIPLIIFFALNKFYDNYVATGAQIAATTVQVIVTYAMYIKVEKMQHNTFVLVALFGGKTLALHD
ncbi:septation protein IspZ, partial [Vibrio cholerae]|uniref:septation protein IspZ n=1 Tax=Vibrio cholerae TaxID=666 RepID=UPI0039C9D7E0